MQDGETRPKVAVFVTRFLEYSQTFVFDELRHHERYSPQVFCRERVNAKAFQFDPVHVADGAYRMTRRSPSFDDLFARHRFDVVHAHFGMAGVYAMRYARRFRRPLVVTFHGNDVARLVSTRRFLHPRHWGYLLLATRMLRMMRIGLCASQDLLELLHQLGVPRDRLRLHHLGVDLDVFRPREHANTTPKVVMIGRLVEKKGFDYGLRAFAYATQVVGATLDLIGSGNQYDKLVRLAQSLGIEDRVRFHGAVPHREVATQLRSADILLAPSVVGRDADRDSGLIVAKEASACGVVPIGTQHGGIPEIIDDGVTGYLVPERDVAAMASRLTRVLDDSSLRHALGRAARAKMKREYDTRDRVNALADIYDQARDRSR